MESAGAVSAPGLSLEDLFEVFNQATPCFIPAQSGRDLEGFGPEPFEQFPVPPHLPHGPRQLVNAGPGHQTSRIAIVFVGGRGNELETDMISGLFREELHRRSPRRRYDRATACRRLQGRKPETFSVGRLHIDVGLPVEIRKLTVAYASGKYGVVRPPGPLKSATFRLRRKIGDLPPEPPPPLFRIVSRLYDQADQGAIKRLDEILSASDDAELARIASEMDATVADLKRMRRDVERIARRNGLDPSDIEIRTKEFSGNPITKIGRDRDVTFYVANRRTGADLGDVDHAVSRSLYEQEFYRAVNRVDDVPRVNGRPDHAAISRTAEMYDQAVTTGLHPEAYAVGEAEFARFIKGEQASDHIEAIRDTFAHKGQEWFHRAAQAGDPAQAARDIAEGMRQTTKQYDRLIGPRLRTYGLKPGAVVPERIQAGMEIFRRTVAGEIPPAQAENMLSAIGLTKERLVDDVAHFFEAVEKGPGRVYRAANADRLASGLARMPGRGSTAWVEGALERVNDAWKQGRISAEAFKRFRSEALQGRIAETVKVGTSQAWQAFSAWTENAWRRRLISVTEKAALQEKVPPEYRRR